MFGKPGKYSIPTLEKQISILKSYSKGTSDLLDEIFPKGMTLKEKQEALTKIR